MMCWNEIYDRSVEAVDAAMEEMLEREGDAGRESGDGLQARLQDSAYVQACLEKRARYDGRRAFRALRRRRRWMRVLGGTTAAACVAVGVWLGVMRQPVVVDWTVAQEECLPELGMKALLVTADGERVVLGREERQLGEAGGVRMTADSSGLSYVRQEAGRTATVAMNTLIVPRGGIYMLALSDGTQVWMNAESRLEYPVAFGSGERRVTLSGEAYFEVASDTARLFVVMAGAGEVRVLGTEFNVKNYPAEALATTLVSGKVSFSSQGAEARVLVPGEQLVYDEEEQSVSVQQVNVRYYTAWRENVLSFQGEALEDIVRVLARWYDLDFIFEDRALREEAFSGNLDRYVDVSTFFR
ncbi:MAG: FecR domain-containing protein, partial [Odoribacter sp.]|nr:FecR domain-containing protein [Odoribacter sp.]